MLNKNMNSRPTLTLDKEVISKADVYTIENMRTSGKGGAAHGQSSVPTTPTTFDTVSATTTVGTTTFGV
jgi:hypothetical protein